MYKFTIYILFLICCITIITVVLQSSSTPTWQDPHKDNKYRKPSTHHKNDSNEYKHGKTKGANIDLDNNLITFPQITLFKEVVVSDPQNKILFIGDVHGQYHEYMEMIDQYSTEDTTTVLLGDFITRGPHSKRMVDHIIRMKDNLSTKDKLECILGNNEIMVLLGWLQQFAPRSHRGLDFGEEYLHWKKYKPSKRHIKLAKRLGFQRLLRLTEICSVRLDIDLPLTGEKYVAVHAGILPTDVVKEKDKNDKIVWSDIWSTMDMRWVNKLNWKQKGKFKESVNNPIRWYKLWQNKKFDSYTVVYGHDAHNGLEFHGNTVGLDTACARGSQLTSMEIFMSTENNKLSEQKQTEQELTDEKPSENQNNKKSKYARALHQIACNRRS